MQFKTYERGDIILVNFNPSLGHEQQGFRPGLVWTNRESQQVSGFVSLFPITSHDKNYPLHVNLKGRAGNTKGVVMTDQIISIDLEARSTKLVSHVSKELLQEVEEIFSEMTV